MAVYKTENVEDGIKHYAANIRRMVEWSEKALKNFDKINNRITFWEKNQRSDFGLEKAINNMLKLQKLWKGDHDKDDMRFV